MGRIFRPARPSLIALIEIGQVPSGGWPGQPGNPVGFAATPASSPVGAWPGAFRNISLGLAQPCTIAEYAATLSGGVIANNSIISFIDFISPPLGAGLPPRGSGSNIISTNGSSGAVNDVQFIGCRFQAYNVSGTNIDCFTIGCFDITFSYCSSTPPASLWLAPPVTAWPSASVGTGFQQGSGANSSIYSIPYQDGSTFGFSLGIGGAGFIIVDHCDIWGCVCGINMSNPTTHVGTITITDNWVHDIRTPNPPTWSAAILYPPYVSCVFTGTTDIWESSSLAGNINKDPTGGGNPTFWNNLSTHGGDHSNGIGYPSANTTPQQNVTIRHNVMASLGDVEAMTCQTVAGNPIVNWTIVNNYLSGFDRQVGFFDTTTATYSNVTFTDNVFATDILGTNGPGNPLIRDVGAAFTLSNGNNCLWRRNRIKIYPGSDTTYFASQINQSGSGGVDYTSVFAATGNAPYVMPDINTGGVYHHTYSVTDWAN
jgi:hypothetical protein